MSGRFIVFEGAEGVGKSTQAKLLSQRIDALLTKEPGGCESTKYISELVLSPENDIPPFVEALLFTADRAVHVEEVIKPALAEGRDVVCDRFTGSFLAYQGYGRGMDISWLQELSAGALNGLVPDIVFYLKPKNGAYHDRNPESDRFEGEDKDFHNRVLKGYGEISKNSVEPWKTVEAKGPIQEISDLIHGLLLKHFQKTGK